MFLLRNALPITNTALTHKLNTKLFVMLADIRVHTNNTIANNKT